MLQATTTIMNNSLTELSRYHITSLDAARNLMNEAAAAASQQQSSLSSREEQQQAERELRALTAGQVADLTQMMTSVNDSYYEPMDPFVLQPTQAPPEAGRLQTRLYALKAKLANNNKGP